MMRTDWRSVRKGGSRLAFYLSNFLEYVIPDMLYRQLFSLRMRRLTEDERQEALRRARHYARIPSGASLDGKEAPTKVGDFKYPFRKKHKFATYFFDLYHTIRLFDKRMEFRYLFGDVSWETPEPTFVKSRPITSGDTNSVLMKLNSSRHFHFIRDGRRFQDKCDRIVFRNVVRNQPHRLRLLEMYFSHPMCDFGRVNTDVQDGHPEYLKPYMTVEEQLGYKFICCIEGNDVATNLKWVMSSNSIAVMPRPKIESWFMESQLVGGVHYVEVADDYSDLIEKVEHYILHPEEAEAIIRNAHEYVGRFLNARLEEYTSYLTARRYFDSQTNSR